MSQTRGVSAPIVLYWCAFLVVGLSVSLLGPALSELRDRSGADIGGIGVLFVGQALGGTIGAFVAGRCYDRFVSHRVFACALFVVAGAMATIPWLDSVPTLFVTFFVIGAGTSGIDVGGNTMVLWQLGSDNARSMNVLHLCFGLGALSAPLLVYVGVDAATRVAAVSCVVFAVTSLTLPSPVARVATEHQEASPRHGLLAIVATFFLFYVGLEVAFAGWLPTYAEEIGFDGSQVAWVTATFWIGFTAGRLVVSVVGSSLRPIVIVVTALALTLVAAAVLVAGSGTTWVVWVTTAAMGAGAAPQFPAMMSYLERRIHVTGTATAWFIGASGIGGLVFPWVVGRSIDSGGPDSLPHATLLLAICTIAAFAATNRRLHRRRRGGRGGTVGSTSSHP